MVAAGQSFASAKKNDPEKSEILLTTSPCRSRYVSRYARENAFIAVLMMCPEGSFTNAGSPAMPVTDDPELSPLAILAVNTLRETYHQRGPHAFDEAALILFMAIGSIIARTRGPETLHGAMEAVRLAVETEVSTGPAHRRRSTNENPSDARQAAVAGETVITLHCVAHGRRYATARSPQRRR
jgi:hypothetical protein